jgi:hypothetical protein
MKLKIDSGLLTVQTFSTVFDSDQTLHTGTGLLLEQGLAGEQYIYFDTDSWDEVTLALGKARLENILAIATTQDDYNTHNGFYLWCVNTGEAYNPYRQAAAKFKNGYSSVIAYLQELDTITYSLALVRTFNQSGDDCDVTVSEFRATMAAIALYHAFVHN